MVAGFPWALCVKCCAFVLYLLVMVVVFPIARHTLNHTVINWEYAAMYPCRGPYAELDCDATVHVPGVFGAKLPPYNVTLSTDGQDPAGRAIKVKIAETVFPEMKLKTGDNILDFISGLALPDTSTLHKSFLSRIFDDGKTAKLFVESDHVKMIVLGFLPVYNLKLSKTLTCHGKNMTAPKDIPAKYCQPQFDDIFRMNEDSANDLEGAVDLAWNRRLSSDQGPGYAIICTPDTDETLVV